MDFPFSMRHIVLYYVEAWCPSETTPREPCVSKDRVENGLKIIYSVKKMLVKKKAFIETVDYKD